jgi:acylphosphatase
MKKSVRLYIKGIVQGVFFRSLIKDNAEKLDVRGFTRNLEDGRVEVFLEGDPEKVNQMIEICRKGPKYSQIHDIEIIPEKFQDLKGFKVLHF